MYGPSAEIKCLFVVVCLYSERLVFGFLTMKT